jgi:hypothetical protein
MSVESVLGNAKVAATMRDWKNGKLRRGSAKVKRKKDAISLALSQSRTPK